MCHISYVTCQVSNVVCQVSCIIIFLSRNCGACWWRVCYQWRIPCPVFIYTAFQSPMKWQANRKDRTGKPKPKPKPKKCIIQAECHGWIVYWSEQRYACSLAKAHICRIAYSLCTWHISFVTLSFCMQNWLFRWIHIAQWRDAKFKSTTQFIVGQTYPYLVFLDKKLKLHFVAVHAEPLDRFQVGCVVGLP